MTAELDAFDFRVGIVQKTISTLQEDGYEVATAQETFDKIAAMRSELASALSSEDYSSIESANQNIHAAFVNLSRIITHLHVAITIPVPGFVGSQVEVPR
jgi:DNA-binding GntR family transcriptional regulator